MDLFVRKKKRLWPFVAISCFVLATALLWCVYYFSSGKNLQLIDMQHYARVDQTDDGGYSVTANLRQMLEDLHLPNPYLSENEGMDVERYPDVKALSTLSFVVTEKEGGYLIQTASDDGERVITELRSYGYGLTNTEWTWTAENIVAAYLESQGYPLKLNMPDFVNVSGTEEGGYVLSVATEKLLHACGWILPDDPSERESNSGYRAVMSLGFLSTQVSTGYQIDTTSTIQNVVELLTENGVELTETSWIWSVEELQSIFTAQGGIMATPQPTITPVMTASPTEPAATPSASDAAAAQPTGTSAPNSPTQEPEINQDKTNCLTTLYGYDQLPLRQAIRDAKEDLYGNAFKSSEVLANYFFVATSDAAAYANCFRILYSVKTNNGTQYLTADVYNLHEDDAVAAANVVLHTFTSKGNAADLKEFPSSSYTKHSLVGGNMIYSQDAGKSPFDDKGLVFADSLERNLTSAELWKLPASNELTLLQILGYARNEIFAMFGHKYTSGKYHDQYAKYDWYQPTGSYSYNDIEAKKPKGAANISLIKELERLIKEG